ncbi:uncharacterized protein I206_104950 [Kwoniella pini CBS 10737]|uniref:Uncharacterized protein n=1 Tax=Kwoniella pini CBS 10737 TaxID=1296096 RepID=A0A1B9I8H2_9TREE|nr:uncharacterized protein I206_02489 [Kwoniella pini CBS 10737]OCF51773.1 hypothetical protein I206_02489 [Kwoniella pini CBS 10737]
MAAATDCNMNVAFILSSSALGFTLHHTYKLDKCKCLLPKRKEWFRVLLTWMLISSEMMIIGWALGWTVIKYHLGWMWIPDIGAMPYPSMLFDQKYVDLNIPLMIIFNLAFSIQASLNAEEGLYWYHLMRAVRQPKSSRSWLTSAFFYAWIIISIVCTACQSGISWLHRGALNLDKQITVTMTVHGFIEFAVMLTSSIVIWKFPAFLADVKASGAGPEVRSRLHFYHEANKIRTFFRALFAICMIIIGIDGMTEAKRINMNRLANDLLTQIIFGSFFFVLLISTLLYVPRNWTPESELHRNRIMVGDPKARMIDGQGLEPANLASGIALMSLLREGGQWDNDDDLRGNHRVSNIDLKKDDQHAPFHLEVPDAQDEWRNHQLHRQGSWDSDPSYLGMPMALENFTSPIAVQKDEAPLPSEIRIRIEQEKQITRNDDMV